MVTNPGTQECPHSSSHPSWKVEPKFFLRFYTHSAASQEGLACYVIDKEWRDRFILTLCQDSMMDIRKQKCLQRQLSNESPT